MYRAILILVLVVLVPVGYAANLNVDASKKKKTKLIQPAKQEIEIVAKFQNKRFETKKLDNKLLHNDARFPVSSISAGETMSLSNGKKARIVDSESKRTSTILKQVVTSSEAFEKAYRDALTIELVKRAGAKIEVKKTKKEKVSQADINKEAKVRRSQAKGFDVQQAGSEEE